MGSTEMWCYVPEHTFLANAWRQEEDRYVADIEAYRRRINRWLIVAILFLLVTPAFAEDTYVTPAQVQALEQRIEDIQREAAEAAAAQHYIDTQAAINAQQRAASAHCFGMC